MVRSTSRTRVNTSYAFELHLTSKVKGSSLPGGRSEQPPLRKRASSVSRSNPFISRLSCTWYGVALKRLDLWTAEAQYVLLSHPQIPRNAWIINLRRIGERLCHILGDGLCLYVFHHIFRHFETFDYIVRMPARVGFV